MRILMIHVDNFRIGVCAAKRRYCSLRRESLRTVVILAADADADVVIVFVFGLRIAL